MAFFDTFDRTGSVEFPFPKTVVFRALCEAVAGIRGMSVEGRDELAGRIDLKTGMSAFSWGERISVSVSSSGPCSATISVSSGAKTIFGSATAHGKNNQNVRQIIAATSNVLQHNGDAWRLELSPGATDSDPSPAAGSVADELEKLAGLRDRGLLTPDEFELQKRRLLQL